MTSTSADTALNDPQASLFGPRLLAPDSSWDCARRIRRVKVTSKYNDPYRLDFHFYYYSHSCSYSFCSSHLHSHSSKGSG